MNYSENIMGIIEENAEILKKLLIFSANDRQITPTLLTHFPSRNNLSL